MARGPQASLTLPRSTTIVKPGLYEKLVTAALQRTLDDLQAIEMSSETRQVEPAESPLVLTQHFARLLQRTLESVPADKRASITNALLTQLMELAEEHQDPVVDPLRQLHSVQKVVPFARPLPRPAIPLNSTDLLINARGEHRVGTEIIQELASADQVDLLCSFLKWSGFRLLHEALEAFVQRGGTLRVITTCYLGATEQKALDALAELGSVKVSYDKRRTRLHAKAWLFHRHTGYSTAFIGSSNMSASALLDGLEWNVRLARYDNPRVLQKFEATFESYWQDPDFEDYNPKLDRARFAQAVKDEQPHYRVDYHLQVRPYPFQSEILERLMVERTLHNRWANLVVAATGTGKTVMAALDYRTLTHTLERTRLLFVAHREEILKQSQTTFRAVLQDGTFGELWTGNNTPSQSEHLFASVQKLANVELQTFDRAHFDVLIIDEFHHAAAPTYRRLIEHFQPRVLLGLTATPERADEQNILHWFGDHIAAELRLWDALERGLLVPFQYFGISDNTDLSTVDFKAGRYLISSLEHVYTADEARAQLVIKALHKQLADPHKMRALGFCVSVKHAEFMAAVFAKAGFKARAVTGGTTNEARRSAISALRKGELQIIFTVDVFNEGVDIPEVDTLLLLRPTESATVFLQQLGRGLRLHDGKECLTVLDFIGQARKEYRFDVGFRALVGGTRKELATQIEQGFPHLPSGCSIQLDRTASEMVLKNVRQAISGNKAFLKRELLACGPDVTLSDFLERAGLELTDLYRGNNPGWMALRASVGYAQTGGSMTLARAMARLLHMDSFEQISYLRQLFQSPQPPTELPGFPELQRLAMLHFSLWNPQDAAAGYLPRLQQLWDDPWARHELLALLPVLQQRINNLPHPLSRLPQVPLSVHCQYGLSEILAAFQVLTPDSPHRIREGVYYHQPSGCDLFFITIRKNEKDYSPSTLYRDYAISQRLFHWESQSTTRADSPTGKRYQSHHGPGGRALLFVRQTSKADLGHAQPYLFLGPAEYVSHAGERPMAITWRLEVEIPGGVYRGLGLVG